MTDDEAAIEAILFISGEAISLSKLSYAIEKDLKTTKIIIDKLIQQYNSENRGIQIIKINNAYQMCTNHQYFKFIQRICNYSQKPKLSQALIETLAIIAYKQPITKSQIEQIRGVNAEHAVNKLAERNLIKEVGKMDTQGKPTLFGTTDEFLKYFGFSSLSKLPKIEI